MEFIKKRFKLVIFDMDGTIIDTETMWQEVTKKVLENRGISLEEKEEREFLHSLAGKSAETCVSILKEYFKIPVSPKTLLEEKQALLKDRFSQKLPLTKGFEQFHAELSKHNMATCIATNANRHILNLINTHTKLSHYFGKHMYCVEDVYMRAKPDPSLFLHAAERFSVDPADCVVFEDSMPGFVAAQTAGMHCIAMKNHLNEPHRHLTHHEINDFDEALDALRSIVTKIPHLSSSPRGQK